MKILFPLFAVITLIVLVVAGVQYANMSFLFGVIIPYLAVITFVTGIICRVLKWTSSPVPFRIPTTCGQANSLPWIKQDKLDNPSTAMGVIVRMALEVFFFVPSSGISKLTRERGGLLTAPTNGYGWGAWLSTGHS